MSGNQFVIGPLVALVPQATAAAPKPSTQTHPVLLPGGDGARPVCRRNLGADHIRINGANGFPDLVETPKFTVDVAAMNHSENEDLGFGRGAPHEAETENRPEEKGGQDHSSSNSLMISSKGVPPVPTREWRTIPRWSIRIYEGMPTTPNIRCARPRESSRTGKEYSFSSMNG